MEEARRVVVDECERLLRMARSTQPKRVTQITGPFLINNIALGVSFRNPFTRLQYELPHVASIFVSRGQIFYNSYDNEIRRYGKMHEEPYEEAVRIVEAEQATCGICTHGYP